MGLGPESVAIKRISPGSSAMASQVRYAGFICSSLPGLTRL